MTGDLDEFETLVVGDIGRVCAIADCLVLARAGKIVPNALARSRDVDLRPGSGVAVIPILGVLVAKVSPLAEKLGLATSTNAVRRSVRDAIGDPKVRSIVFDIDCPGGGTVGVPELCRTLGAARSIKPTFAVANHVAGGAAYWLASQCSEVYCTISGEVGSIGVVEEHSDYSEALSKDGVAFTFVAAGKYKVEGNPFQPLARDARAYIQAKVDAIHTEMVAAIAGGRRVSTVEVRGHFGEGRSMRARAALDVKMIDGVVNDLDQVMRLAERDENGLPTLASMNEQRVLLTRNAQLRRQ